MIERFNELYIKEQTKHTEAELAKAEQPDEAKNQQKEPDWKEKINSKLSKLISIEYHEKPVAELMAKDEVYRLVNEGKFSEASVLMSAKPEYQTEDFAKWQKQITAAEEFNQALKQRRKQAKRCHHKVFNDSQRPSNCRYGIYEHQRRVS